MRRTTAALTMTLVLMTAGCGGDDGGETGQPRLADDQPETTTTSEAPTTTTAAPESAVGLCAEYIHWYDNLEGDVDREVFYPWLERFQNVDSPEIIDVVAAWTPSTPWSETNTLLIRVQLACEFG